MPHRVLCQRFLEPPARRLQKSLTKHSVWHLYHHPSFLPPFYNDEEHTENGSKFLTLFVQNLNLSSAPHYSLTDREITHRDNYRALVKSNACSLKVMLSSGSKWQSLSCSLLSSSNK